VSDQALSYRLNSTFRKKEHGCVLTLAESIRNLSGAVRVCWASMDRKGEQGMKFSDVCGTAVLLVLITGAYHQCHPDKIATPAPPTPHAIGERFSVGYWTYVCNGARGLLGNSVVVDLTVQNNDKSASNLPPPQIVDEVGNQYEARQVWEPGFLYLVSLNPGMSTRGVVVFDVPTLDHHYRLQVSGGFHSRSVALVEITKPDQTEPAAPPEPEPQVDRSGPVYRWNGHDYVPAPAAPAAATPGTVYQPRTPASGTECLSYAPALVTLTGALTEKSDEPAAPAAATPGTVYQPRTPETYWVLNLGQPICTTGGEHSSNVAERNVSSLQLLFTNDEVYQRYRFLLNTTVKVTGSLASGTTAQHYTQVVLQVVPPEGSAPLESVGGH
jgi:hypothetical protein